MLFEIARQEESLIVILKDLSIDLSFISAELNDEYRHLILDLIRIFRSFSRKAQKLY